MKVLIQFIKFGLVGVSNTIVNYVIYFIVYTCTSNYVLANVAGWLISVLNAFVWQQLFVFQEDETKQKRKWWLVLIKTYVSYAFTGLIVNNILSWMWIDVINISSLMPGITKWLSKLEINVTEKMFSGYVAPALNAVFVIPINFITNRLWAYRQKELED